MVREIISFKPHANVLSAETIAAMLTRLSSLCVKKSAQWNSGTEKRMMRDRLDFSTFAYHVRDLKFQYRHRSAYKSRALCHEKSIWLRLSS